MLKVPTYLAESTIPDAGMGLFAKAFIPRGTAVWELELNGDTALTPAAFASLAKHEQTHILHFGYLDRALGLCIRCGDDGHYFNHSENPNIAGVPNDEGRSYSVAIRDIAAGGEILDDYRTYDDAMHAKGLS
jgi:SET domain-containing protein